MKIGRPVVGIRRAIYSMRAGALGLCVDYLTDMARFCSERADVLEAYAEHYGALYRAAKRRARGGQ